MRLLLPIARALDFAHRQNMIHRDVKPSNILITADGEPMLTDFGIAKILDLEETQDLTGTGMGIGTPEYMAPEQWTGKTSTLSDQYALGVVLYEMLTGRKPYSADTPAAILLKQATEPLPRPSQFARDLPEKVEKLLIKTLAKNPEDRYVNMAEMAAAMERTVGSVQSPALSKGEGLLSSHLPLSSADEPASREDDAATIDQGMTDETVLQEDEQAQTTSRLPLDIPNLKPAPPSVHHPRRIWWLWPIWILATSVGMGLAGAAGFLLLNQAGGMFAHLAGGALGGALLGMVQWLALRKRIPSSLWWIALTAAAFSLYWFGSPFSAFHNALVGAMLGALQWLLLRRVVRRAGWWPVLYSAGFASSFLIILISTDVLYYGDVFEAIGVYAGVGAYVGFFTGWLLILLLRGGPRPQPTGRSIGDMLALAGAGVLLLGGSLFLLMTGVRPVGRPYQTLTREQDGMEMVYVPAGEFTMGSSPAFAAAWHDEKPHHTVYLDAFWMDRTEVTNGMYGKCVRSGVCEPPHNTSEYDDANLVNHPVVNVDWRQAAAYCAWAGARLPTEAEWEKAARGTDGRLYPWGNAMPDSRLLNFTWNVGATTAVGIYPGGASPYGAFDMAGNVWEWVADWYDSNYYSQSPSRNPQGPASGDYRVLRGGSWNVNGDFVRSAFRYYVLPGDFVNYVGFRCARGTSP